jgi:hypothetical protein
MTSTLTALAIAVSGTSLICFLLMARAERRRNKPKTPSDGGGSDGSTFAGGDDGSHFWGWFGGDHSASDSSGHSGGGDSVGAGDSGGGSDNGGGDGGGD